MTQNADPNKQDLDFQGIVALDIALHGKRFILIEFIGCMVVFSGIALVELTVSILFPTRTSLAIILSGVFLLALALNCLTLLILALRCLRQSHQPGVEEFTKEQINGATVRMARLILLPLVLPIAVFAQERQSARKSSV